MLVSSEANPERNDVLQLISDGNIGKCSEFFIQKKPSVTSSIKGKITRLLNK